MLLCKKITLEEKHEWRELVQKSHTASFFQQKEWLQIWLRYFPLAKEIVGVFDNKKLVAIAPLAYKSNVVYLVGTTPVMGDEIVCDFGDIICMPSFEKEVWLSTIEFLSNKHSGKKLQLNFIKRDSPSYDILKSISNQTKEYGTSPYVELPGSWEEYLATLRGKDRKELKRKLRRIEPYDYKVYFGENSKKNQKLFLGLMKQSSFEKEKFLSKAMQDFFSHMLTYLNKDQVKLWFMEIDKKVVASVMAFRFKNELLLYNSGMDMSYTNLSAGLLSKALLIKKSIELGLEKADFLQGNERYKYNLGAKDNKLYNFTINL